MATLTWRAAPVFWLTVRQFLGGKAIRVVIGLSLIPVLFGLIYMLDPSTERPRRYFGNVVFVELMIPTLLPLTVLVLGTSAFGDEVEDRTLPYLLLKPVSRLRIVMEKLIGSVLISGPIVIGGLAITYALVFRDQWQDNLRLFAAVAVASAVATVTYSAIFMLVSLLISRALVAALIYSLVWESILGRWVPGLRYVSIRHFVRSIFADLTDDRLFQFRNSAGLTAAVVTLLAASLVAVLLSTWRLRVMNLE
jgi:ABC-2 type transport system permease protein